MSDAPDEQIPPSHLGRLRLRLRATVREALQAQRAVDANADSDANAEANAEAEAEVKVGEEAEEEKKNSLEDASVGDEYSDMPDLEVADPRSPPQPQRDEFLRHMTADAMMSWVAAMASSRRARTFMFRSHAPHVSLAGISAGEMEEAVEHAYTELVPAAPHAWPDEAERRPSRVQFRLLMDSGLVAQMVWYRNSFGGWPSDAVFFAETLYPHLCPCFDGAYPVEDQVAALAHLIRMGQGVRCRLLPYIMMYHLQEGRWPSYAQWSAFLDRFMAFERDPVQYYQDDRQHAPVRGLERLPVTAYTSRKRNGEDGRDAENKDEDKDELQCAMCFDDLAEGQAVVVLPACGHTFHAQGPDCIGTTVLQWFMKEHTCPTCRTDVVV